MLAYIRTNLAATDQAKPLCLLQTLNTQICDARQTIRTKHQSRRVDDNIIHQIRFEQRGRQAAATFTKH